KTLTNLTVNLGSANNYSYLSVEGNNTLTLGPTVTVNATGYGYLTSGNFVGGSGAIVNQGLIEKTVANGTSLYINPSGGFTNQGTLRVAADGGYVVINSGGVVNDTTGTMQVLANGTLEINGTGWVNKGSFVVNGGLLDLLGTNWSNQTGAISLSNNGAVNFGGSTTTAGLGPGGLRRAGTTPVKLTGPLHNTPAPPATPAPTRDHPPLDRTL